MAIVDTSVWIEFFKSKSSPVALALADRIIKQEFSCINGFIEMELLQGTRNEKDARELKSYLKDFQYFPNAPYAYFELASEIYRHCRSKGVTIRKSVDCLIAANALIEELPVLHHDRDFMNIAKVYKDLALVSL
jgi:predicted nucleic acid-binding protein